MAGVHLEECVSEFGFGGKWNVRGLSGKKRERKRGDFWHYETRAGIGEWRGFSGVKKRREREEKTWVRKKRVIYE